MGSAGATPQGGPVGTDYPWQTGGFTLSEGYQQPMSPLDWASLEYKHFAGPLKHGNWAGLGQPTPDRDYTDLIERANYLMTLKKSPYHKDKPKEPFATNREFREGGYEQRQRDMATIKMLNKLFFSDFSQGETPFYWGQYLVPQYQNLLPSQPYDMPWARRW